MKNTLIKLAAVATLGAPLAVFAQAKSFEGFYGEAGLGYGSFTSSFSGGTLTGQGPNTGYTNSYAVPDLNINSIIGSIGVGYNFALTNEYILGVGASYSPSRSSSSSTTPTVGGVAQNPGNGAVQNIYSVYLSPGYALDNNSLVYAKVGYTGATAVFDGTTPNVNLTGYVLGLGFKKIIDANLYGYIEGKYASYGSTDLQPTALSGSPYLTNNGSMSAKGMDVIVGVGYKF